MTIQLYRSPLSKHIYSLVINGFYTRELEADDFAFIEYVRKCGIANGSLPRTDVVLLEELEFWHLPYSLAPAIERRVGRRRTIRQMSATTGQGKSRALKIIRENEKAIADAELAREQHEWKQANERRKARQLRIDFEWEAAAPRTAKFGATIKRHYVPQWRLDENTPPELAKPPLPPRAPYPTPQEQDEDRLRREAIIAKAREDIAIFEKKEQERQRRLKMRDISYAIETLVRESRTGIRR